jgi:DNA topoisomerase VI subunit B
MLQTGTSRVNQPRTTRNGTPQRLERVTFRTSRQMDFFSERELVTQTGYGIDEWPLVIVKELVDNSLDAAEEADVASVIEVTADASGITVGDNGPGLPEATLRAAMDFGGRAKRLAGARLPAVTLRPERSRGYCPAARGPDALHSWPCNGVETRS